MSRAEAAQLGARVALVLVGVGVVVGLVWWRLAPTAQVRLEAEGGFFVDPDPETYIASDVWFAVLSLVAGAVAGVLLWRLVHRAAVAGVLGLAVGGTVGALVAAWIGQRLGHTDPAAVAKLPAGSLVHVSLEVQATAVLFVLPLSALAGWLVRDLLHDRRVAREAREAADRASADSLVSPVDPPQPPPLPSA
jgi:uncharacterized membrane protein YeaQ/YmgE (transglycosylase-associated protein family)